jgi:hypothetical protein
MVNETFPSTCLPGTDTNTPLPLQRFTPALHGPPPSSPFARYFCPPTPLLHTSTPRRLIGFFSCVRCVFVEGVGGSCLWANSVYAGLLFRMRGPTANLLLRP